MVTGMSGDQGEIGEKDTDDWVRVVNIMRMVIRVSNGKNKDGDQGEW